MPRKLCLAWLIACFCCLSGLRGDDWPQWMGPGRDSVWREQGIMRKFPAEGLSIRWRTPIAGGYSGPAVADGLVVVTDYQLREGDPTNSPSGRNKLDGTERVICLNAADGSRVWSYEYECSYHISYPAGPRATPTIADGKVYALGAEGDLVCLDLREGNLIWKRQLRDQYNAPTPLWGFCAHPLVDGDKLICIVGGEGSVAVAFDRHSGEEIWRSLSAAEPGYCPPTMISAGGVRQLLIWHSQSINALDPESGKVYWSVPLKPDYGMSIAAPRQSGSYLFASGIGNVGALYKLASDRPHAEILWSSDTKTGVYSGNSTPVVRDGVIYGSDCQVGVLRAVALKSGKRLWETFKPTTGGTRRASHGTAFIVEHEDRFFLMSETGDLILAKLSNQKYEEISRYHLLEPTGECFGRAVLWSHPAFANRCVYARNDKEIVCASLAQRQP